MIYYLVLAIKYNELLYCFHYENRINFAALIYFLVVSITDTTIYYLNL